MTLLGDANWWAPRFMRRRVSSPEHEVAVVEPTLELAGRP